MDVADSKPQRRFHINRKLVPIKLLITLFWGGNCMLNPFFNLYLRSLGITDTQIGYIISVSLWVSITSGPLITGLADKTGRYKLVFALSIALCVLLTGIFVAAVPLQPIDTTDNSSVNISNTSNNLFSNVSRVSSADTADTQPMTFYIVFVLYLVSGWIGAGCFLMLDTIITTTTEQHHGDFGINRAFIQGSIAVFPVVSGLIIDSLQHCWNYGYQHYYPGFIFYSVLLLLAIGALLMADIAVKPPAKQLWRNVWTIVVVEKNYEIWAFLGMIFCTGVCIGYLEGYLYLYLDKLFTALPKSVLGADAAVSGTVGMLVVSQSAFFVNRLGHMHTLALAVFVYAIRFTAYSFITDIWMIYPLSALSSLSSALMWSVACDYAGKLVPDYLATFQSLMSIIQTGFGIGGGYIIGGFVIAQFDSTRVAYRFAAGVCFAVVVIYVVTAFFQRKNHRQNSVENKLLCSDFPEKNGLKRQSCTIQTDLDVVVPLIRENNNGAQ